LPRADLLELLRQFAGPHPLVPLIGLAFGVILLLILFANR